MIFRDYPPFRIRPPLPAPSRGEGVGEGFPQSEPSPSPSPAGNAAEGMLAFRRVALGMVLVACVANIARADVTPTAVPAVTVQASVDRKEITIGDPLRYTVEVSATADTEVLIPLLSGAVGAFTISDFGEVPTRKEHGRVIIGRWYTLTIFETGDHLIPAPKVQYRTPGEALREADGNEVLVGVTSLLGRTKTPAADIRDVKPPEVLPFDWRPYGIATAVVVAVGLLGTGLYLLLNRPKRQRVVPPRPPHEVALAALNRLRSRGLVEQGQFEVYYVELSAIVRHYLEDGFHLRAPEMTTEEFLGTVARDARLVPAHRRLLAEFLSQADLVKFARHLPTLRDAETAYDAARRFVDDTRPAPTAAGLEKGHAAA